MHKKMFIVRFIELYKHNDESATCLMKIFDNHLKRDDYEIILAMCTEDIDSSTNIGILSINAIKIIAKYLNIMFSDNPQTKKTDNEVLREFCKHRRVILKRQKEHDKFIENIDLLKIE